MRTFSSSACGHHFEIHLVRVAFNDKLFNWHDISCTTTVLVMEQLGDTTLSFLHKTWPVYFYLGPTLH
jgi:hypothetical protein